MVFVVRLEIIGVMIYFFFCISDIEFLGFMVVDIYERFEEEYIKILKGRYCKYVFVIVFSRSGEFFIFGRDVKLSNKIEKFNGIFVIFGIDIVRFCFLFGVL